MEENQGLAMGITGVPLNKLDCRRYSEFTNEELNKIINAALAELNAREYENLKIDVNINDAYIDNRYEHRKALYIIKSIDKRTCFTIISGMRYSIEYNSLCNITGEKFSLKTDILKNLQKLENFDASTFESEINDINLSLNTQWNAYIDNLKEQNNFKITPMQELLDNKNIK